MIEIISCKPLSEATPEELADLRKNGWLPKEEYRTTDSFQGMENCFNGMPNRRYQEN